MSSRRFLLTRPSTKLKLLVIEDNDADFRLIQEVLNDSPVPFEISHATRCSEGITKAQAERFDLIVLDLGLPDTKGLETLLRMAEVTSSIPLLVLTGLKDEKMAAEALSHGAEDYVYKDEITNGSLLHSIYHAVDRHYLHSQLQLIRDQQIEDQKLQSLGILAGGIAHDFNNLLTIILGKSDRILREPNLSEDTRGSLNQIKDTSLRAADLCRQLLAYSGKGKILVQPLNVTSIVEDLTQAIRRAIPKNINVVYQLPKNLPLVNADASQLCQVIMNLVINASEAIGERAGEITVRTGVTDLDATRLQKSLGGGKNQPGTFAYIEVMDNGCGMDESTLAKIFEPFFTTKFTGRGLGLAAVYGIASGCQGALEVLSEKDLGSTFRAFFPISKTQQQITSTSDSSSSDIQAKGSILVADDEMNIQEMIVEMVQELGFEALPASDGFEAVRVFSENPKNIVLVLLDMTMPKMGGEDVFDKIRKIRPDIRILLMSGYSEAEVTGLFEGKTLTGFIQKPFSFESLREKIHVALTTRVSG
jgi:two-component system, cell cycle sensor histidine kinase and response regulator CckA